MGVGDTFAIGKAQYRVVSKPMTTEALRLWGMIARCTKRSSLDAVVSLGDAFTRALMQVDASKLREEGSAAAVIHATLGEAVRGLERSTADFMDLVGHDEFPALVMGLLRHAERNGLPLDGRTIEAVEWEAPTEPMDAAREVAKALGFFARPSTSAGAAPTVG